MMYVITLNNQIIHSVDIENLKIFNAKVKLEQNEISQFNFTIYPTNPFYNSIKEITSIVTVYQGNTIIFRGRVIETESSTNKGLDVYCESVEGYLCDSLVKPYEFTGSIKELLTHYISAHNSCVGTEKQFKIGKVTVTDPNDYIVRSNSEYSVTWDEMKKKLVDMLGGYFVIRHESDGMYIDYLEDFTTLNAQYVEFGKNMLSVKMNNAYADIGTVLIPLGTKLKDEEGKETGERLTIESVNNGLNYIENAEKVAKYGRIVKTKSWDDVTVASNLLRKGQEYLTSIGTTPTVIEISAIDMANINKDISNFKMYSKIRVVSKYHDIDQYFTVEKMDIDLFNQKNNKITLNGEHKSLTSNDNGIGAVKDTVENIKNNYQVNVPNRILELRNQLTSLITQTANSIKTEVSNSYFSKSVDKDGNLVVDSDLISAMSTSFEQNSQSFIMQFNQFSKSLEDLQNGTNANFEDIRKFIRFDDGNIILGQVENPFSLILTKDKISFMQGEMEIAYVSNTKLYITFAEVLTSLKIGNFAFIPRDSGNLTFKKVV